MHIIRIPADTRQPVTVETVTGALHEALSVAVGGPIEPVVFRDRSELNGHTLYVNKESKVLGLPPNPRATGAIGNSIGPYGVIYGDAVVAGPLDANLDNLTVTDGALRHFRLGRPTDEQD